MVDKKTNPNKAKPFVINIFCADGDPNGIRIINKSNWSGQGLVFPRELFKDAKELFRDAKGNYDQSIFKAPGVYVLVGNSNDDSESNEDNANGIVEVEGIAEDDAEEMHFQLIYIGEGDPVEDRLDVHNSDTDKNFWESCVFFVGRDLNKAHIQYLEASLLKIAKDAPMVKLVNKNEPTFPNLSLPEKAIAEGFLDEMLSIFPFISVNAFQKIEPPEDLLYIIKKGVYARGYKRDDGFVVLKDSTADIIGAGLTHSLKKLKKQLIKEEFLRGDTDHMVFIKDCPFKNPARAAGIVLGHPGTKALWEKKKKSSLCDTVKKGIYEGSIEPEGT